METELIKVFANIPVAGAIKSLGNYTLMTSKLLKKIIGAIIGRKYMAQDQAKIDAKLQELRIQTGHDWIPVEGYHALTSVEIKDVSGSTSATFNPGSGIPVKAFINTITGEIRMFPYKLFESQN